MDLHGQHAVLTRVGAGARGFGGRPRPLQAPATAPILGEGGHRRTAVRARALTLEEPLGNTRLVVGMPAGEHPRVQALLVSVLCSLGRRHKGCVVVQADAALFLGPDVLRRLDVGEACGAGGDLIGGRLARLLDPRCVDAWRDIRECSSRGRHCGHSGTRPSNRCLYCSCHTP